MDQYRQEFNPGYNYRQEFNPGLPCHIADRDDVGTQSSAQRMTTKQARACILQKPKCLLRTVQDILVKE